MAGRKKVLLKVGFLIIVTLGHIHSLCLVKRIYISVC